MQHHRFLKSFGPIALSALSIFICMLLIQPLACKLDPSFSLYANRGIGKIGITLLVFTHIFMLLLIAPKKIWSQFININFSFFASTSWIRTFFSYVGIFFVLHALFLGSFIPLNAAVYHNAAHSMLSFSLAGRIAFGFVVTFFLAWTEELIFRGTVYPLIAQHMSPLWSAIWTSIIFMGAHDLHNPLNLITHTWKLGLGLFLLGLFLNLVFITTKKLYTGMGIHAGLVFVKVVLRRLPLITFLPSEYIPWWLAQDLRQAPLAHILLAGACVALIIHQRKTFDLLAYPNKAR